MTVDTKLVTLWLQAMVRINSVNPVLAEGGVGESVIADWLVKICTDLGFEVQLQETEHNRPNVIAHRAGTGGGRSILLTGHTDTVSIENMEGDPFDGRIENGRLYGRGSLDMKGGLAAILGAAAALRDQALAGDLWLGFVTDEEYASVGTDALVRLIHPDAAILTEPTQGEIVLAHKGFAWLTLTTQGKAAHGSLYDTGVDAIAHMGRLLQSLEALEREQFPKREHELVGRASAHASMIMGGLGLSTYPDRCRMEVEHRLLPDETVEDVIRLWEDEIGRLNTADPDFTATVEVDFTRPGYEIDRSAPIVQTLAQAYKVVRGSAPTFSGMYAWLD
ncbi:MAG TPA: M20/M25/M40 family metallo-hydrolase, partial [Phototrophicaceae bacterium]|nr:M20/M25/M40 family metallo-hydrolase [Phototrophicaceae bacterium]